MSPNLAFALLAMISYASADHTRLLMGNGTTIRPLDTTRIILQKPDHADETYPTIAVFSKNKDGTNGFDSQTFELTIEGLDTKPKCNLTGAFPTDTNSSYDAIFEILNSEDYLNPCNAVDGVFVACEGPAPVCG